VTLYNADALDVCPLLPASSVSVVCTDIPYAIVGGGASVAGKGTDNAFDTQFFRAWFRQVLDATSSCTADNSAWWTTVDWRGLVAIEQATTRTPYRIAGVGVWNRGGLGMGFALRKTYENFVLLVRDGWARTQTDEPDVWSIDWFPSSRLHGHQAEKPVELMERALRLCGGTTILDPFAGSGTTGVACIQTGRAFIGVELEERYCAIAARRFDEAFDSQALYAPVPRQTQSEMFAEVSA